MPPLAYPFRVTAYLGAQGGRRRLDLRKPSGLRGLLLSGLVGGGVMALAVLQAPGRGAGVAGVSTGTFGSDMARAEAEAVRIPLSPSAAQQTAAARRFQAFSTEAALTPAQQRQVATELVNLRESWLAAIAYFDTLEESDPGASGAVGLLSTEHASELHTLVQEAAANSLGQTLDHRQQALLSRHLGPLATFVAAIPSP